MLCRAKDSVEPKIVLCCAEPKIVVPHLHGSHNIPSCYKPVGNRLWWHLSFFPRYCTALESRRSKNDNTPGLKRVPVISHCCL